MLITDQSVIIHCRIITKRQCIYHWLIVISVCTTEIRLFTVFQWIIHWFRFREYFLNLNHYNLTDLQCYAYNCDQSVIIHSRIIIEGSVYITDWYSYKYTTEIRLFTTFQWIIHWFRFREYSLNLNHYNLTDLQCYTYNCDQSVIIYCCIITERQCMYHWLIVISVCTTEIRLFTAFQWIIHWFQVRECSLNLNHYNLTDLQC
jgi:hypothetical protein